MKNRTWTTVILAVFVSILWLGLAAVLNGCAPVD